MKAYYYHFPNSSAPHAALNKAVKAGESPFAESAEVPAIDKHFSAGIIIKGLYYDPVAFVTDVDQGIVHIAVIPDPYKYR